MGGAAYSLAGFVSYRRMNDNRHYLHDVMAGATIGTAFGYGVCLSEDQQKEDIYNKNKNSVGIFCRSMRRPDLIFNGHFRITFL